MRDLTISFLSFGLAAVTIALVLIFRRVNSVVADAGRYYISTERNVIIMLKEQEATLDEAITGLKDTLTSKLDEVKTALETKAEDEGVDLSDEIASISGLKDTVAGFSVGGGTTTPPVSDTNPPTTDSGATPDGSGVSGQ